MSKIHEYRIIEIKNAFSTFMIRGIPELHVQTIPSLDIFLPFGRFAVKMLLVWRRWRDQQSSWRDPFFEREIHLLRGENGGILVLILGG